MKFRRKAQTDPVDEDVVDDVAEETAEDLLADGPYDSDDLPPLADGERVDLGSLLITPEPDRELRLQVDEASGNVQSVVLAGPDGALELRAFAAPRDGDLWSEARPQIAAEVAQSGGTATEREGPWGTELICQVGQRGGNTAGHPGDRHQRPALDAARLAAGPAGRRSPRRPPAWEDSIRRLAVHRGAQAMPVGEALPVVMPPQARRVEQSGR